MKNLEKNQKEEPRRRSEDAAGWDEEGEHGSSRLVHHHHEPDAEEDDAPEVDPAELYRREVGRGNLAHPVGEEVGERRVDAEDRPWQAGVRRGRNGLGEKHVRHSSEQDAHGQNYEERHQRLHELSRTDGRRCFGEADECHADTNDPREEERFAAHPETLVEENHERCKGGHEANCDKGLYDPRPAFCKLEHDCSPFFRLGMCYRATMTRFLFYRKNSILHDRSQAQTKNQHLCCFYGLNSMDYLIKKFSSPNPNTFCPREEPKLNCS